MKSSIDKIENIYKILSDEISNGREYFLNYIRISKENTRSRSLRIKWTN
ncbi:hypothetical protein ONA24_07300 [Mycoplasmopsis cynos]|nr:hypothetical protein [Mycoplasmopsis cynos]WAM09723.1 hypothetical protein ONA24_07300 [Mycoplasmopsis cynos]